MVPSGITDAPVNPITGYETNFRHDVPKPSFSNFGRNRILAELPTSIMTRWTIALERCRDTTKETS